MRSEHLDTYLYRLQSEPILTNMSHTHFSPLLCGIIRILHMKKILLAFLILFISISMFAERIDGPANIRTGKNGVKLLTLFDNVEIDCTEPVNDWYQIGISIQIDLEQYEKVKPIEKGDTLKNWRNEIIGIALIDIPDSISYIWSSGGAPGNPKRFGMEIFGSTFKSNIRPESIVEPVLKTIIEDNNGSLTLEKFRSHMTIFKYQDGLGIPDYEKLTTYMVYENAIDDPSPLDRVRLIFEGNNLIAIVHSRELELSDYKTYAIERGRKLTLLKQFSDTERAIFIEKNKQTYWGID